LFDSRHHNSNQSFRQNFLKISPFFHYFARTEAVMLLHSDRKCGQKKSSDIRWRLKILRRKTMKIKIALTALSIILAFALNTDSQNNSAPNAAASFSVFSAPQNMGAIINSADNETNSAVSPNGLSFYFTSNRAGGQGGQDILVSQRATLTSAWGVPQNLGAVINSSGDDSMGSFSLDGRTMFFHSNRAGGAGDADIYVSTRTDPNNDFGWTAPVSIGAVINTASQESGAGYFENPTGGDAVLYFVSNRAGGLGDLDIYQSTRNADGTFNPPTNVTQLNSVSREARAWVRRDGLEIFLASDRTGTLGSTDIYVSTRASVSAPWNPPVNVTSLNTAINEGSPTLSPDGSILYFNSVRPGGSGIADLYTAVRTSVNRSSSADFDGDGRTDYSVFRPTDGTWYVLQSGTNTFRAQQFGTNGDKIVPGDYDGDGRTDFAVFRQVSTSGVWYILQSSDNAFRAVQWGLNTDRPTPGDYDGDGRTDVGVYRNGVWYVLQSSNGQFTTLQFGASGDIPVAGANVQ
jgi:Tol biopolymer transport system component